MRLRVILDDGTPRCLPDWARDEIVRRRLEEVELLKQLSETRVALAIANGAEPFVAHRDEWLRSFNALRAELQARQ